MERDELLGIIEKNADVIRRFGVRRLGLFGSVSRGEGYPGSDLDFIVEFENVTFDAYMDLKFFLEDLFAKRVDLVISDSIKPRLRPMILKEVVYAPGL